MGILLINTCINAALAMGKIVTALCIRSEALLSDGFHSFADTLSGVVLLVGIRLSARAADAKHPYGHERFECVAAILLAVIIGVTGSTIGLSAVELLVSPTSAPSPSVAAVSMPISAIAVKEIMFR